MNKKIIGRFRDAVRAHRDSLLELLNPDSSSKRICLGPYDIDEVSNVIQEHDGTLARITKGEFGKCDVCKDEVEIDRLELDFTTQVCLGHYTNSQLKGLERDLELAAKVQKQLLPQELPILSGIQIAAHTEPAHIVSGDYFDFYKYPDDSQGIAVADVMGKGLAASMLMSKLQAFLRILGPEQCNLHTLAGRLNELFRYNLTLIRFISLFLIRLDAREKKLSYCNAGHNPGIYWNAETNSIKYLNPTGPALGLAHEAKYTSTDFKLGSGDLIVLYTDGLVEAKNKYHEEFSTKRLENFVIESKDKSAKEFLTELRKSFEEFSTDKHDDVTLLTLKVL